MDPTCGKGGGKGGIDLEKVPADHAKAERVRGFAEFVDKRVGALLEAAGAAGLTARQLVKGVNGEGTVYGEVTLGHVKASLDSMEVTYRGDRVWLTKFLKDAEHAAEAPASFTPWAQEACV